MKAKGDESEEISRTYLKETQKEPSELERHIADVKYDAFTHRVEQAATNARAPLLPLNFTRGSKSSYENQANDSAVCKYTAGNMHAS